MFCFYPESIRIENGRNSVVLFNSPRITSAASQPTLSSYKDPILKSKKDWGSLQFKGAFCVPNFYPNPNLH